MSFCITRYVSDDLEKLGQGQISFEKISIDHISATIKDTDS